MATTELVRLGYDRRLTDRPTGTQLCTGNGSINSLTTRTDCKPGGRSSGRSDTCIPQPATRSQQQQKQVLSSLSACRSRRGVTSNCCDQVAPVHNSRAIRYLADDGRTDGRTSAYRKSRLASFRQSLKYWRPFAGQRSVGPRTDGRPARSARPTVCMYGIARQSLMQN